MSKKLYDFINYPIGTFTNSPEFKRALNKVLCCTNSGGGGIQSIVAGTNVTVDATDPLNPIVSATDGITGTGTNNVLTKWTGTTSLGNSLISEDATTVKIGAIGSQPTYAFGIFGTTNGLTITGEQNALSLTTGNLSTNAALTVLRNNTSANIAEFSSPLQNVFITASGSVQASALAGVGTRMVVSNASGLLSTQTLPTSGWALPGNSGTSASTDFVGTTDNVDLSFRVNNNLAGFINISAGNTSFGNSSLPTRTTGNAQSAFGAGAMALAGASSAENSAFGSNALFNVNNGQYNSVFGAKAGETLSGSYNSAFGAQASKIVSGNKNIAIGYLAGSNIGSGSKNICVSTEGNIAVSNSSNQLNIGNVIWGINCTGTGTTPAGSLGIGTITPNISAILDLTSTTQGFLKPRTTTTQKNAIGTPATGLELFDTTLNTPEFYNGTAWTGPWNKRGNFGTNPTNDFIGTNDNTDIYFKAGLGGLQTTKLVINNAFNTGSLPALGSKGASSLIVCSGDNLSPSYGLVLGTLSSGDVYQQSQRVDGGATAYNMSLQPSGGSLNIGTTTTAPSAIVNIASTSKGFLPPRMTTAEINAIPTPAEGLLVFNITLHTLCFFDGTIWQKTTSIPM